jgi:hypothetical protein
MDSIVLTEHHQSAHRALPLLAAAASRRKLGLLECLPGEATA